MNRVVKNEGFTLVELSLAMAFVSALLLAVAMTTIQIGHIYNRGLMLKEINQSGSSLASELQDSIVVSTPFDVNSTGGDYVSQDWGGRLCTGQYSFVWNYGEALLNNDSLHLNVYDDYESTHELIRFVKVSDPNGSYCKKDANSAYKDVVSSDAVELLDGGQHQLAIHSFKISTTDTAVDSLTGQSLYSIEFLLGTNDEAALNYESDDAAVVCKLADEEGADPSYCYINQFNIVARAGNSGE